LPVLRAEDAYTPLGQQRDLVRHDRAATAAEDAHVRGSALGQPLDEVAEVLDVTALVRGDGHPVGVFLQGGRHDLVHAAVVAEVYDLGALALQQPPHHGDRRVVAVEQAGRGHEADRVDRHVQGLAHGTPRSGDRSQSANSRTSNYWMPTDPQPELARVLR
jgi:hypothetical protein